MCAQHALNAILQGHFYDPTQLAQIADELSEFERNELGLSGQDAPQFTSQHLDENGNFSVEVIDCALKAWEMNLVRWRPCAELRGRYDHPENEFAFLLNLGQHWLALRGFGHVRRIWYNLNSFFPEPQWVSDTYLGTFLHQAQVESYSIFAVEPQTGTEPPATIADDVADTQRSSFDAEPLSDDDADLQAAIRASLNESTPSTPSGRRRTREENSSAEDEEGGPMRNRVCRDYGTPGSGYRSRRRSKQREKQAYASNKHDSFLHKNHSLSSLDMDEEDLLASDRTRKSPFLNPLVSSLLDEDVEEIESENALTLDDDEKQLQAAIASSLGKPYDVSQCILDKTRRALTRSCEPESELESEPEDVMRIRKLREQAQHGHSDKDTSKQIKSEDEVSDSKADTFNMEDAPSESSEPLSAEEMRRRRLARFS